MSATDILLIEDNKKLSKTLTEGLNDSGFSVRTAESGTLALALLDNLSPDLILLDLGLPDIDGLDLFVQLKEKLGEIPIIIITARGAIEDRVKGLDLGSDDYLVKPFAFVELVARVKAVIRRSDAAPKTLLAQGPLKMDVVQRVLTINGDVVDLPLREFSLLQYLMEHKGEVVSRDMLASDVWRINKRVTSLDNAIDVHISRLREKLKDHGVQGILKTVRGSGFTIES